MLGLASLWEHLTGKIPSSTINEDGSQNFYQMCRAAHQSIEVPPPTPKILITAIRYYLKITRRISNSNRGRRPKEPTFTPWDEIFEEIEYIRHRVEGFDDEGFDAAPASTWEEIVKELERRRANKRKLASGSRA
jgi:hypothetical protein